MKKKLVTFVLGLIKKGEKYLLTKRKEIDKEDPKEFEGKWQIPGGGIKFGEKIEVALKREIREEIGLEINIIKPVPYIIDEIRQNWHGIGLVFLCTMKDKDQIVQINSESSEYGWFSYEQALRLHMLPGGKDALKAANSVSGTGLEF